MRHCFYRQASGSAIWTALIWVVLTGPLSGQDPSSFKVSAATNDVSGITRALPFVVLTWPDAVRLLLPREIVGYNLYRKIDENAPYPLYPLNSRPIAPLRDGKGQLSLTGFLGNTPEWKILEKALAAPRSETAPRDNITLMPQLFDPHRLHEALKAPRKYELTQWLGRANWKIAVAMGQGYQDSQVVMGKTYYYELRAVDARDVETVLDTDIAVTAGMPAAIPAPDDLKAQAGDSRVLLTWGEAPDAAGFRVYRSTTSGGPYEPINEGTSLSRIGFDVNGVEFTEDRETITKNGLLDIQKWDKSGNPIAHKEVGRWIDGPFNGTTYYYKVACVDLLGNQGPMTRGEVSAKPVDTTDPLAPSGVTVTPRDDEDSIDISWVQVTRDTMGHPECVYTPAGNLTLVFPGIVAYRVYRYENADDPSVGATLISGDIPHALKGEVMSFKDTASLLRPAYGEKSFWYRVECVDAAGNVSARSAAVSGFLKDKTPPLPLQQITAESYDTHIVIDFPMSSESAIAGNDIAGYRVYRNICNKGGPLDPSDSEDHDKYKHSWVLVGTVTQSEADDMVDPFVEDWTVPKKSPLCYVYIVKVLDEAQNTSAHWPPDFTRAPVEPYVCARLQSTAKPDPAVITGLKARDGGIRVEWIGPPQQNMAAYYVYRSNTETGTYSFVGGKTVGNTPQTLTAPLTSFPSGCQTPMRSDKSMSEGYFLDNQVLPKRIYWYRVLGVYSTGYMSDVAKAVPVSTFTYDTQAAQAPVITQVTQNESPCGLKIQWTPAFNGTLHAGFAVLRGTSSTGSFQQVGTLVTAQSEFIDATALKGVTYWYKVLQVNQDGTQSAPSSAKKED